MYPVFTHNLYKGTGLLASALILFLAIFILSEIRKNNTLRILLFALTILFSVQNFYLFLNNYLDENITSFLTGLPMLFGPIMLLYIQQYIKVGNKFELIDYLHFAPFLLVLTLEIIPGFFLIDFPPLLWMIVVLHWALFIIYSGIWLFINKTEYGHLKNFEKKWILLFYLTNTLFWLIHSAYFIYGQKIQQIYVICSISMAILLNIYYFKYRTYQLITGPREPKNNQSKTELPENTRFYLEKLDKLTLEQKIYLDPNLTIPKLAEKMQIQPYLLSHIINQHFEQSFPDFINSYRIKEAIILLHDQSIKISSIAADCGFNSLSSFNLAFKKITGKTPSDFRGKIN